MAVQRPLLNSTSIAGLLGVVDANAQQQLADEATLQTLQNQVTNILSRSASAPGSYSPPGAAGSQSYGTTANPWATATSLGAVFSIATTAAYFGFAYYDVWDAANLVDFAIVYNGPNTQAYAVRIQRSLTAKPVVVSFIGISTTSASISGAAIISPKLARVSGIISAGAMAEVLVSWSGSALSITTAQTSSSGSVVQYPTTYYRRAYLLGTASYIILGTNTNSALCLASRKDRNATVVGELLLAHHTQGQTAFAGDQVGNGYFIRGIDSYVTADPTVRPAIALEYIDEFQAQRIATLRITNTNFGNWISLQMISPTLAIGQYTDKTVNASYFIAISVNIGAASPLGLYGPFVSGALGSGSFISHLGFYNATTAYALDLSTVSTVAAGPYTVKLRRIVFNGANAGSEVTTSTANDVTVTLAAGLGLTAVPTILYVQWIGDQLVVVYFGTTGTTSTTGTYIEVFNLS